jgi:hypothetical protein
LRLDGLFEDINQLVMMMMMMVRLYHHQPINVPTAGAQAFLMDYLQGEQAITHHAGPVRIGGWTANAAGTNGLTCLPRHGGARDDKVLVTHPII